MTRQLVKIVPPEPGEAGITLAQGTMVLLPSGEQMKGITKVTLVCDTGDCWRAVIECLCEPPAELACLVDRIEVKEPD